MADKSDDVTKPKAKSSARVKREQDLKPCGLVMPISAIGEYKQSHWSQVRQILELSATKAGFQLDLVSDARDVGVIHKRIIENLFHQELVICDVSGRNPNVMFELGVRFAFDKPTVIVKDDRTEFSFDVQHIEHVLYPADLNYHGIMDFKDRLTEKITHTYQASRTQDFSPFLENYRKIVPKSLKTLQVGVDPFVIDSLKSIADQVAEIREATKSRRRHAVAGSSSPEFRSVKSDQDVCTLVADYFRELSWSPGKYYSQDAFKLHCAKILRMMPITPDTDPKLYAHVSELVRRELMALMDGKT